MLTALAAATLLALLLGVRAVDARRLPRRWESWQAVRSPRAARALAWLVEPINDHRFALDLCAVAISEADAARLRTAVRAVEGFAPGVIEGLAAVREIAQAAGALVAPPAVPIGVWESWRLRGLAGAAAALHALLVTGAERLVLRAWLLGRALRLCLGWLRGAATTPTGPQWARVRAAVADLRVVGDEAERTYEHVVQVLDVVSGTVVSR